MGHKTVGELLKIAREDIESTMSVPDFGQSEAMRVEQMNRTLYEIQQRNYAQQQAYEKQAYESEFAARKLQDDLARQILNSGAASTYASQRSSGGALTEASLNEAIERAYQQLGRKTSHIHRQRHILIRWLRASLDPDFSLRNENLAFYGPEV